SGAAPPRTARPRRDRRRRTPRPSRSGRASPRSLDVPRLARPGNARARPDLRKASSRRAHLLRHRRWLSSISTRLYRSIGASAGVGVAALRSDTPATAALHDIVEPEHDVAHFTHAADFAFELHREAQRSGFRRLVSRLREGALGIVERGFEPTE